MQQRNFDRLIGALLLAGAILFVLLLAGVGSGFLTSPGSYLP